MSSNAGQAMNHSAEAREYPERPIVAVGGVVIHEGRVLLVRRGQPPLEGRWSIPGGILELGETIAEGIAREVKEETGISVRMLELIEIYEKVLRDEQNEPQYHFVILDYACEFVEGAAKASGDVKEAAWISESELPKMELTSAALRVVKKGFAAAGQRTASSG